jgi:hypothetical protein
MNKIELSAPTNFAPLISKATEVAKNSNCRYLFPWLCTFQSVLCFSLYIVSFRSQSVQKFIILLILTDGMVSDMGDTIDAIIEASACPLSIVIIGVGPNYAKEKMEFLDSDGVVLKSVDNKRSSKRDIVQYVP